MMVEEAVKILGKIDILVNTQGDWLIKPTLVTTEEMWDHLMDTSKNQSSSYARQ